MLGLQHLLVAVTILLVGVTVALTSVDQRTTFIVFAGLATCFALASRPGEPPVWHLVAVCQWLQVGLPTLRAWFAGTSISDFSRVALADEATELSIGAVCVFLLGARLAAPRPIPVTFPNFSRPNVVASRLFRLWLYTTLVVTLVGFIPTGDLFQLVVPLAELRWVPVFALFLWVVNTGTNVHLLAFVLILEILTGFLSFFSSFKTPLLLLVIAWFHARPQIRPSQLVGLIGLAAVTITLGLGWTHIKTDYRAYMSQYTGKQEVVVSISERATKLQELATALQLEDLGDSAERLADRLALVDFFALTLQHVPAMRPHDNGGRMLLAVEHVLAPRFLFPNKPALDDMADTEEFTGLHLRQEGQETSVCVGYPAEAYVEFEPPWMFLPLLGFGLIQGRLYGYFIKQSGDAFLASGFAVMTAFNSGTIERTFTKMLGGSIVTAIVFIAVWKIFGSRVSAWLEA